MFGHLLVFVITKLKELWADFSKPHFEEKPLVVKETVFDKFKWIFWFLYLGIFLYMIYLLAKVTVLYQRRRNHVMETTISLKKAVDKMREDVAEPLDAMSFKGIHGNCRIYHRLQSAVQSDNINESSHTTFVYPNTSEDLSDNESNGQKLMERESTIALLDKCDILPGPTVFGNSKCEASKQLTEDCRLDGGETNSRQEIVECYSSVTEVPNRIPTEFTGSSRLIPLTEILNSNFVTSEEYKVGDVKFCDRPYESLDSGNIMLNMETNEKANIYDDVYFGLPVPIATVSRTELYFSNVFSDTSGASELSASEANVHSNKYACKYGIPNNMIFDSSDETQTSTVSTLNIGTSSLDTSSDSTFSDNESVAETRTSDSCASDSIVLSPSCMHKWNLQTRTCDCRVDFMVQKFEHMLPQFDVVIPLLRSRSVSRMSLGGAFRRAHSAPAACSQLHLPCFCSKLSKSDGSLLSLLNSTYPYNNFMKY